MSIEAGLAAQVCAKSQYICKKMAETQGENGCVSTKNERVHIKFSARFSRANK